MSTDSKDIKELLERYYQAETTIEEERLLRAWFSDQIPDEDLAKDAAVLQAHDEYRELHTRASFAEEVLARIGQDKPIRRLPLRRALAYAATIALLISAGWWMLRDTQSLNNAPALTADTYENPDEALMELEAALDLISTHFAQGLFMTMESLEPVEELDIFVQ